MNSAHPSTAPSWRLNEVVEVAEIEGAFFFVWMMTEVCHGEKYISDRHTNSHHSADVLHTICVGK